MLLKISYITAFSLFCVQQSDKLLYYYNRSALLYYYNFITITGQHYDENNEETMTTFIYLLNQYFKLTNNSLIIHDNNRASDALDHLKGTLKKLVNYHDTPCKRIHLIN